MRRRLSNAGYRDDLITAAVGRLGDLGMLDDGAFAKAWVESRDRARPRGERALRQELQLKGIDRETTDSVLGERAEADPEVDADEAAARRLLERNRRGLERIADPRARRQRAYALLARNGFDADVARDVSAGFDAEPGPAAP